MTQTLILKCLLAPALFVAFSVAGVMHAKEPSSLAEPRREKLKVSRLRYEAMQAAFDAETVTITDLYAALIGWKEASCEIAATKSERIAALTAHRDRMQKLFEKVDAFYRFSSFFIFEDQVEKAHFWLLQAEIWLQEAKNGGEPPVPNGCGQPVYRRRMIVECDGRRSRFDFVRRRRKNNPAMPMLTPAMTIALETQRLPSAWRYSNATIA